MELLYVGDLVLIARIKQLLLDKVRMCREGLGRKGLRKNLLTPTVIQKLLEIIGRVR